MHRIVSTDAIAYRESRAVAQEIDEVIDAVEQVPHLGLLVEDRGRVLHVEVRRDVGLEDRAVGRLGSSDVEQHCRLRGGATSSIERTRCRLIQPVGAERRALLPGDGNCVPSARPVL